MIHPSKIEEVRRLLNEGRLSQRQIAQLTGVSRGTIGGVASGKREDRLPNEEDDRDVPLGPVIRCPGCGGLVYSPCVLCRVRDIKANEAADRRQKADRAKASDADRRRRFHPDHDESRPPRS